MTRDEIIERMNWQPSASHAMSDVLDRIEKTVRAAEREARDQAVTAERESCAELAERMDFHSTLTGFLVSPDQIADAIRARGQ